MVRPQPKSEMLSGELDSSLLQLGYRLFQIVAIEGDVGCTRRRTGFFQGVATHIGFREVKNKPPVTDVDSLKAEFVSEEGSELFRLG